MQITNDEQVIRDLNDYQQELDKLKQRLPEGYFILVVKKANTIQENIDSAYKQWGKGESHAGYIGTHLIGNIPNLLKEFEVLINKYEEKLH